MHRYIYGEDPASQADFHGIVIHELPEIELDNQTPLPLLRDIYALNNTSFDKILDYGLIQQVFNGNTEHGTAA